MMRALLIIISLSIICSACGKKGDPEYKSTSLRNLTVYLR